MSKLLERIRLAECRSVHSWFEPGMQVLEIGGGNGYQARIISDWGCNVVSVDLRDRSRTGFSHYAVQDYDGRHLPFTDGQFDVVFSSNVLEHVAHLQELLSEVTRVIKPGGVAIHILPTPSWRFWTSLTHYPYLIKYVAGGGRRQAASNNSSSKGAAKRSPTWLLRRAMWSGPHGEYPNAATELWYFSRRRWLRVFDKNGFDVVDDYPNQLFYTGYATFPQLPMKARSMLSQVLGSSCRIFVMRTRAYNRGGIA